MVETNNTSNSYQHLIDNGYEFKLGDYINRGFEIFKKDPGPFIGFSILFLILTAISAITVIGVFFVAGPLTAGFYIYANKVANDEPRTFSDFFSGFNQTGQLGLGMLVMAILVMVGMFFFVIPGIYLAIAYGFMIPLISLGGMEFWDAMETSRKVISKNWWWFLLFAIVVGVISASGQILLYVGMFVTMPIAYCIQYAAFESIMGETTEHFDDKIDEIGTIDEIDETPDSL